jgi:hypothetical protein
MNAAAVGGFQIKILHRLHFDNGVEAIVALPLILVFAYSCRSVRATAAAPSAGAQMQICAAIPVFL